jgi:hypothetical protein
MGIHYGGDIVFERDLLDQFVDQQGGLRIQPRIGLITKKIAWI